MFIMMGRNINYVKDITQKDNNENNNHINVDKS
jgi:hypothetical protein